MSDIHGTYQRASVLEAARLLGVSPTTVRRMVRAGTLRAERVHRPQGHTFVVLVPTDSQPAAGSSQQVSAEARAEQPPGEAIAAMIAATLTPIIAPLVGELAASRQANERQAETIREQAETIGELRAERNSALEALRMTMVTESSPQSPPEASGAAQPVTPTMWPPYGRLRALAPWLPVLATLAIVAAVGLMGWPR